MVLNQAALRLGVSLKQTEDELIRNMLASTASQINATGGTNGDLPTDLDTEDVIAVTRALYGADARTLMDNIEAEDKFGTSPIRKAFIAMAHTDLIGELEATGDFTNVASYPSPNSVLRAEYGSIDNVRFLLSSIGSVTPNASTLGADVYNIFVSGIEAYACVQQNQYSAQFVYRPPIYSDALAQNCTIGWKMGTVPRILNDQWILNLRVTLG